MASCGSCVAASLFPDRDCKTFEPVLPVDALAFTGTASDFGSVDFAASDNARNVVFITSTASLDLSSIGSPVSFAATVFFVVVVLVVFAVFVVVAGAPRKVSASKLTVETEQLLAVKHCLMVSIGFKGGGGCLGGMSAW